MNAHALRSTLLQARIALGALQPVTLAAATLCAAGALAWGWWIPHQQAGLDADRAELRHATLAAKRPADNRPHVATTAAERAKAFYAVMGDRQRAEEPLQTLFNLARDSGLALAKGDYKSSYDRSSHVYTYQAQLPVTGPYPSIRRFCEQALLALPYASLDEIAFRRDTVGNGSLEARLRFTLHLADVPAAAKLQRQSLTPGPATAAIPEAIPGAVPGATPAANPAPVIAVPEPSAPKVIAMREAKP